MRNEKAVLLVPVAIFRFISLIYRILYVPTHMYMYFVRLGIVLIYTLLIFYAIRGKAIPTFLISTSIFIDGICVLIGETIVIQRDGPVISELLGTLLGVYFICVGIRVFYLQVKLCVQRRRASLKES